MDIGYFTRLLLGQGVFLGLMFLAARMYSRRWRDVGAQYARQGELSWIASKWPESIVITRRGTVGGVYRGNTDYQMYAGVRVRVRQDGIGLSLIPVLNVMSPPLFLPFTDMEVYATKWALWSRPMAIRMRRLPEIDLVIGRDLADWIGRQIPGSSTGWRDAQGRP